MKQECQNPRGEEQRAYHKSAHFQQFYDSPDLQIIVGRRGEMFHNLENVSLLRRTTTPANAKQVADNSQTVTTLAELARSSDYLLFYVLSSSAPPNPTFLRNFQQFLSNARNRSAPPKKKNFNATTSPAKFKRLFGMGGKKTAAGIAKDSLAGQLNLNVVVVDVELSPEEGNLSFVGELGLFLLPPQTYLAKSRVLRALGFVNAPSLFVLDCSGPRVLSQAYRPLMDDPEGSLFPWKNSTPAELFSGDLLQNAPDGSIAKTDFSTLGEGVKGLFFGAKWCPPSRQMCKQLAQLYPDIKREHPQFQIIFCSYDRSEASFLDHFASMPWLALPYGREAALAKAYDVQGIPSFLLLDEHFSLITRNGRNLLLSDPRDYPWRRRPLYELTEYTAHRLSEMASLILFTEGSPEDTEFSLNFLTACVQWINSDQQSGQSQAGSGDALDPLQVFYTGEDPVCDFILESLGQEQAELPLLMICDVMAGHLAICEKPDVSEEVLLEFVRDYREGRARVEPIPSQRQEQKRVVAGIPADVLQQMVVLQQQQPQSGYARSA